MKTFVMMGLVAAVSFPAYAEDPVTGKYTGNMMYKGRNREFPIGLTLDLQSVENGVAKGTLDISPSGSDSMCSGVSAIPFAGKFAGDKLRLRAEKFGRAGDCSLVLILTPQGSKLVGTTYGGNKVDLSR